MTTNHPQRQPQRQPQRYGGLLGVAGGVLALIGTYTVVTLDFMPDADAAVASFSNDSGQILGGGQMLVIGALLLASFGAVLHKRIQTFCPESSLSTLAATGYALAALAAALGAAGFVGGALRVDEHGEIAGAQATTMADIGMLTIGAIMPAVLALGVGAASVAALRSNAILPRWLAWLGIPITLGLVIMPINFAALPVGLLWTVVAGAMISSAGAHVIDVTSGRVATPVGA